MISGVVLTRDNERTIGHCIESIRDLVSELVVVDDGSTDATLDIVRRLYPKVMIMSRSLAHDFAAQRNAGLEKVSHDWVVMVDSDEVVTSELAQQIRDAVLSTRYDAYASVLLSQSLDGWTRSHMKRPILFRSHLRFDSEVHENISDVSLGRLSGVLEHHSWVSVHDFCDDLVSYSHRHAELWHRKYGRRSSFWVALRVIGGFHYVFYRLLICDGKWRLGWKGVLVSLALASDFFLTGMFYLESDENRDMSS